MLPRAQSIGSSSSTTDSISMTHRQRRCWSIATHSYASSTSSPIPCHARKRKEVPNETLATVPNETSLVNHIVDNTVIVIVNVILAKLHHSRVQRICSRRQQRSSGSHCLPHQHRLHRQASPRSRSARFGYNPCLRCHSNPGRPHPHLLQGLQQRGRVSSRHLPDSNCGWRGSQ